MWWDDSLQRAFLKRQIFSASLKWFEGPRLPAASTSIFQRLPQASFSDLGARACCIYSAVVVSWMTCTRRYHQSGRPPARRWMRIAVRRGVLFCCIHYARKHAMRFPDHSPDPLKIKIMSVEINTRRISNSGLKKRKSREHTGDLDSQVPPYSDTYS